MQVIGTIIVKKKVYYLQGTNSSRRGVTTRVKMMTMMIWTEQREEYMKKDTTQMRQFKVSGPIDTYLSILMSVVVHSCTPQFTYIHV